jgi:3-oxoacyl-[acyl-carrier-protein] synthase-3
MHRAFILSSGGYLPKHIITNEDLPSKLETSHEWIVTRTGIHQRHQAAADELTSDMGAAACQKALERANISIDTIDFVICATTTPDATFPATATIIQHKLGMKQGFAFDLQAVCTGFVYALAMGKSLIASGQATRGIVVGAEKFTSILDWEDRGTAILFGDGAGAVILDTASAQEKSEILGIYLHSDGAYKDLLYTNGGAASTPHVGKVVMQGREVFRHAVEKLGDAMEEALERNHLSAEDVDWFVPHQANRRIIEATADRHHFPREKVILTVDKHANTSAASIPLALNAAVEDGRLKKGNLVLIDALGGGFTWGAGLIRW